MCAALETVELHPHIACLTEGVPDLRGYSVNAIVRGDDTTPIITMMLIFSHIDTDETQLGYNYVYLINSNYTQADFEYLQYLPPVVAYKIENTEDSSAEKLKKVLTLSFENGSVSFSFEKAFYASSVYRLK